MSLAPTKRGVSVKWLPAFYDVQVSQVPGYGFPYYTPVPLIGLTFELVLFVSSVSLSRLYLCISSALDSILLPFQGADTRLALTQIAANLPAIILQVFLPCP